MKLFHGPCLHWSADQRVTLFPTRLAMLEDRVLFLLSQSISLLGPKYRHTTHKHRPHTEPTHIQRVESSIKDGNLLPEWEKSVDKQRIIMTHSWYTVHKGLVYNRHL